MFNLFFVVVQAGSTPVVDFGKLSSIDPYKLREFFVKVFILALGRFEDKDFVGNTNFLWIVPNGIFFKVCRCVVPAALGLVDLGS